MISLVDARSGAESLKLRIGISPDSGKEAYVAGRDEVVERRLRDGSTFRVIKNFVDPQELEIRLRRLGWECAIRRDGSRWVYGEARLPR